MHAARHHENALPQIGARVIEYNGAKVAPTPEHGLLEQQAAAVKAELLAVAAAEVAAVETSMSRKAAVKPFVTSSMQQDAARLLHMGVQATMSTAQELFEGAARHPLSCFVQLLQVAIQAKHGA